MVGEIIIFANADIITVTMASIRFKTYGKGVINAPIYIRFINGRDCQFEIKSGLFIPNSDYLKNGKARELKTFTNYKSVRDKLKELNDLVTIRLNEVNEYSKHWLQVIVDEFHGKVNKDLSKNPLLTDIIEKYCNHIVDYSSNQRQLSTLRTYRVTIKRILEYEMFIGHHYHIDQIGVNFKNDFIAWSRNVKKYSTSTFVKSVKQIKTVCRYAKRIGFKIDESLINDNEKLEQGKSRRVNEKPIYMTIDEIEKLMEFTGHDYLENVRDWFVISCWTGCRVSDLMELTSENVILTIGNEKAIRYTQQKTRDTVTTPYHPHVDSIIKRRNGFPRPISDQKFNKYIKVLCKEIGCIELISGAKKNPLTLRMESGMFPKFELITAHTGRRSFASNHYGKFPIEILMLVTGHKSVRQFMDYVGEYHQEHVTTLNQFYREGITTNKSNLNISKNG
jgi:integrase